MPPWSIVPFVAFAAFQAGGGGSFGGGGGGGGSFGGGDGDAGAIFEILFWLLRLALEFPVIGVPLLVGTAVVFVLGTQRGWWKHQERVIRRAQPLRAQQTSSAAAATLRERDPEFDEARFLARVELAFRKAQSAWCAQALEPLQHFASDGVFERFSLQIEEQREDGWRQGLDGLQLDPLRIQHVESGRHFDAVTVRIPFRADIHRVSLATGKRIPGSELGRTSFEECWSFVRRRGAKSRTSAGLIEGQCPNCGARLEVNQSAHCGVCDAFVRSGEFDWVLAEITQASEWERENARGIPGLAALAARDPGVSTQVLEDLASVAFWRWSAAERAGSMTPLARVADPELCALGEQALAAQRGSVRTYWAERAVGSVRTLGFLVDGERERAVIDVTWDGVLATSRPGQPRGLERRRVLRRTLFVLARRAGSTTDLAHAFTSARCPTCGAHDAGGTDPACPYCGAPRSGGASTWRVFAIAPQDDPLAARLRAEVLRVPSPSATSTSTATPPRAPAPSSSGLLAWAVAAARADGAVDEREQRAFTRLASQLGVAPERIDALLANAAEPDTAPAPRDAAEAQVWLAALCELVLSDGAFSRTEFRLVRRAAERLGLSRHDLVRTLNAARASLYRESRAARA